jgi:hypothetical protein
MKSSFSSPVLPGYLKLGRTFSNPTARWFLRHKHDGEFFRPMHGDNKFEKWACAIVISSASFTPPKETPNPE